MDPMRFIRPDFQELEAYTPVKPLDVIAREVGLPVERLVKLDANENLYGPIPEIREAVARADLHIYPDPAQYALRSAIADYLKVEAGQIVTGAGSDDLIDVLIRLVEPAAVVTASPTFGMYNFLARINHAQVIEVPRSESFAVDIAGIERAVSAGRTLVFLPSPNNPTGNQLTDQEAEAICELPALVVLDEAYAEFSGRSAISLLNRYPNLVILRTFSKWAGLAGLRVGYSISHPGLAEKLTAIKQPYNVNVAAEVAALTALEHRGVILETVRALVAERDRMVKQISAVCPWLVAHPSDANFVLFEVVGRDAADVSATLRSRGVLVRHYQRPDLRNFIRISAGRPEDTDRLVEALRTLEAA
jgi:histidinol-phosphate aminotransferase